MLRSDTCRDAFQNQPLQRTVVKVGCCYRPASMPNDRHPRRRHLRLPAYDYSHAGAYFITVCTQDRVILFGEVIDCDVQLNEVGMIVQQTWDDLPMHYHAIDLDAFIVMPNYVHGIIILADEPETLARLVHSAVRLVATGRGRLCVRSRPQSPSPGRD